MSNNLLSHNHNNFSRQEMAVKLADNGLMVIACIPGDKIPAYPWQGITRRNYNVIRAFDSQPENTNVAIICGDEVVGVDFDCHGETPNGVDVFNMLISSDPSIFDGCIIERTASGGIHVYYRSVPGTTGTYKIPFVVNGSTVMVEVLAGRRICVCAPSETKKGKYEAVTEKNLMNYPVSQWPTLHPRFIKADKGEEPKAKPSNGQRTPGMTDDQIIEHFYPKAIEQARSGNRNDACYWLACQLRDNRIAERAAVRVCRDFAHEVTSYKAEPFTEPQAEKTCRCIYASPAREPTSFYSEEKKARQTSLAKLW